MSRKISACFLIMLICVFSIFNTHLSIQTSMGLKNQSKTRTKTQSKGDFVSPNINSELSFLKKTMNDGALGFSGDCLSSAFDSADYVLSGNAATITNDFIFPLMNAIQNYPEFCLGDFTGDQVYGGEHYTPMANCECTRMPLVGSHTYGIIAGATFNSVCPEPGAKLAGCFMFDTDGTAGLIFSGDVIGCGVSLTGIGTILEPFIEFLGAIGFGFSPTRRFQKDVPACYRNNNNIKCEDVTAKSHFMFVLNLALPDFKIGSKDLSDFFSINGTITMLVDFGDLVDTVNDLINKLMGSDQCSEGSNVFREILDTARNLGAELTVNVAGYLTFGLSTLTNGFLPDMDFELFDSAIIITTGGGATGLTTGVYISVENNLAQSVVDLCLNLFNHFSGIFSSFGISSPNVDIASLHFGLYVDASSVGFKFLIAGDAFMCMYKFTNGKGACQYKLSFFTALIEGAKWVIKKAAQLWDETGKVLAEFGANTAQFATDSANAVANFAEEEVYNEIRDGTLAAANTMENTGKEAWESATSTAQKIENMGKSLQEDYNNYVSDVGNMISGFSGKIEDVIVDMTNDVKAIGNQVGSGISNAATSAGNEIVKVFKKNKW